MGALLLAGVVVCAVATVVSIISTAIPYWIDIDTALVTSHQGLWRACFKLGSASSCSSYDNVPDWWKAVQALMILGILLLALSTFLGFLQFKKDSRQIFQGSVFTTVLGGLVLIIAVIVFGVKEKDLKSDFSAGFYLAIVAGVLAFVAAVLMAISKRGSAGYSSI